MEEATPSFHTAITAVRSVCLSLQGSSGGLLGGHARVMPSGWESTEEETGGFGLVLPQGQEKSC